MTTPIEDFAATLSEDERSLLRSSVAFLLRAVAYADSVIDQKEQGAVERAADLVRERFGASFVSKPEDFPDAIKAAGNPDWPQSPYIRSVAAVVRKLPEPEHKLYDAAMLELALNVGGASGGLLGFGDKLSADEKYVIRRIVSALGLQPDEAVRKRLGF